MSWSACRLQAAAARRAARRSARGLKRAPPPEPAAEAASETCAGSALTHQILTWVRAVCACSRLRVANLGSALRDGRALCAILKYYVPELIDTDALERLDEVCEGDWMGGVGGWGGGQREQTSHASD